MSKCNFRRIVSFLLAVATVFVLCPAMSAAAEVAELTVCPCCGESLGALTYLPWDGTVEHVEGDAHYQLTEDTLLDQEIMVDTGNNLVLDLAGYSLTAADGSRCFTVKGTLTVLDSSENGTGKLLGNDLSCYGRSTSGYGGAIYITKGTLNLLSGTVTGGTAIYGGNIYCSLGTLNIYGGMVSKGTAVTVEMENPEDTNNTGRGGNIYLYSASAMICGDARILDGSAWYLSGNSGRGGNVFATTNTELVICGNAELAGGYAQQRGGNVAINSRTTMTLRDNATLRGSSARKQSNSVDVMTSTLTVEGGIIYGSPAGGCTNNIDVYSTDSQLKFNGGKVYGRIGAIAGMTINVSGKPYVEHLYLPEGALVTPGELEDGAWIGVEAEQSQRITGPLLDPGCYMYFFNYEKTGLTWYDRKGGTNAILLTKGTPCQCCGEDVNDIVSANKGIYVTKTDFEDESFVMTAGHYRLNGNVNLSKMTRSIAVDGTAGYVTLDLNGYTITGPKNMRVFDFVGGTFNITDSSEEKTGKIKSTGSVEGSGGVIAVTDTDSVLNLHGGTLTGSVVGAGNYGGSVYVSNGTTFNMYGGAVSNGSSEGHGGNIYVTGSAKFNLYGGTVSDGKVVGGTDTNGATITGYGGNIYVTGLDSRLSMYGGTVSGGMNYIGAGGNIQINSGAEMKMYDGEVKDGSAVKSASNIFITGSRNDRYSSFEMFGGTIGVIDDIVGTAKSLNRGFASNSIVIYNGVIMGQRVADYLALCACCEATTTDSVVWNYGHNEDVCDSDCPMELAWGMAYVKTLQTGQHNYQASNADKICYCTLCDYVYPKEVAVVANGKPYATITQAAADITEGTISLLGDVTVDELSASGITLDLNGYTLTAEALTAVGTGNVIDTSAGSAGKLVCDSVTFAEHNTYLPITFDDGIRFFEVGFTQWLERVDENTTKVKFYFTQRAKDTLIDDVVKNGSTELDVQIRLTWTDENGAFQDRTYTFGPELLCKYAEKWDSRVFVTTIGQGENIVDLTCTYQIASAAASGTAVSSNTLKNVAYINQKLTWDSINSYSFKEKDMTVEEMRDLCVDFFSYAKSVLWTPDTSVDYTKNSNGGEDAMSQGTVYGGLPYVSYGTGNVYRMMDYIDEATGLMDMKKAIPALGTKDRLLVTDMRYFGNQCANAAYVGWGRVINSVYYNRTYHMVPANGYIFLGDVEFDRTIERWTTTYTTKAICQENGEQVLYEAYAQVKKADGLVYYTSAGHVIMAMEDAHVVRNADGTINGNESYLIYAEQGQSWKDAANASGDAFQRKNGVGTKKTFKQIFDGNYIPFTYQEFVGGDPVEVTEVSLVGSNGTAYASGTVSEDGREFVGSQTQGPLTWAQLFSSKVVSNYAIADVYIIVTDAAGNEVYKHAVRATVTGDEELEIVEDAGNVSTWETKTLFPGRTYNVSIEVQLYTGERPTVYNGQLTIDK